MKQSRKVKRICQYCGKEFIIYRAWLRGGKAGKYCSRSCSAKAQPRISSRVKLICEECGKEYEVKNYRKDTSRFCSFKCLHKFIHRTNKGENHPFWKGGISKRNRHKLQKWRDEILKRDNYKCIKCGSSHNLQVHHILPYSEYPDKRFDIDNGVTLCDKCHAKEHSDNLKNFILKERKLSGVYKKCLVCSKDYYVIPSQINTSKFCSIECKIESQRKRFKLKQGDDL